MKSTESRPCSEWGRAPWAVSGRTPGDVYEMTFSYTLERKKKTQQFVFRVRASCLPGVHGMGQGSQQDTGRGSSAASAVPGRGTAWLLGAELSSAAGCSVSDTR